MEVYMSTTTKYTCNNCGYSTTIPMTKCPKCKSESISKTAEVTRKR